MYLNSAVILITAIMRGKIDGSEPFQITDALMGFRAISIWLDVEMLVAN